jgi:hypothetical protein
MAKCRRKRRQRAKPKLVHPTVPIRMRDLPVVMDLERKLLLYSPTRGPTSQQVERFVSDASRELFGITRRDTEFDCPDELVEEDEFEAPWCYEISETERQRREFEQRFKTSGVSDVEAVAILLQYGLDFRDEVGHPLRCTMRLCRQAEAAAKGIAGKLPDVAAAEEKRLADKLEQEAEAFMASRRRLRAAVR